MNAKEYTKATTSAQRQAANKKIESLSKTNPRSSVKTQTKAQRDAQTKKVNAIRKAHAIKNKTKIAKGLFARIDEDEYTPLNWG